MLSLLNDDVLGRVLTTAVRRKCDPVAIMLVCTRFRNVLLGRATAVTVHNDAFRLLRHAPGLKELELGSGCTCLPWDVDFCDDVAHVRPAALAHLTRLTHLNIQPRPNPAVVLSRGSLAVLPRLRWLNIGCCWLSALHEVAALTMLSMLDLSTSRLKRASVSEEHVDLQPLSRLQALEVLRLDAAWVASAEQCAALGTLRALTRLEAVAAVVQASTAPLRKMLTGGLVSENVVYDAIQSVDLANHEAIAHRLRSCLAALPSLLGALTRAVDVFMRVSREDDGAALAVANCAVSSSGGLSLSAHSEHVTDACVQQLCRLSQLTGVSLCNAIRVTVDGLAHLTSLSLLSKLNLGVWRFHQEPEVLPRFLAPLNLGALHALEWLELAANDSDSLDCLRCLTRLTCLLLRGPEERPRLSAAAAVFRGLASLRRFVLTSVEIDADLCAAVNALPRIEDAKIFLCTVADGALARLTTLPELTLDVCELSAAAAAGLSAMRGLECLRVNFTINNREGYSLESVSASVVEAAVALRQLTELVLQDVPPSIDLEPLAALPALRCLEVNDELCDDIIALAPASGAPAPA